MTNRSGLADRRTQARDQTERWPSSLTEITPNKILIRGYPVDEMMGRLGFAEAIYLLLAGELPAPAIGKMVGAILVSSVDHGATPPSTIVARNVAKVAPRNFSGSWQWASRRARLRCAISPQTLHSTYWVWTVAGSRRASSQHGSVCGATPEVTRQLWPLAKRSSRYW